MEIRTQIPKYKIEYRVVGFFGFFEKNQKPVVFKKNWFLCVFFYVLFLVFIAFCLVFINIILSIELIEAIRLF